MNLEKILVTLVASLSQTLAVIIIITKLKNDLNKKNILLFFVISWIYYIIVSLFIPNEVRFFTFILVISILINYILGIRNKKSVIYSIFCIVLLSMSEIIISLLLVLFKIGFNNLENNLFLNLIINVFVSILSIIIVYIPFIKRLLNKILLFSNSISLLP